jgi:ketosteroid isomerase-like protein
VKAVLERYRTKLYVFVSPQNRSEFFLRSGAIGCLPVKTVSVLRTIRGKNDSQIDSHQPAHEPAGLQIDSGAELMRTHMLAVVSCVAFIFTISPGGNVKYYKAEEQIMEQERRALDRWGNGDPQGFLQMYAPDVTYFDPMQEKCVDGLEAMTALLIPITGKVKIDRYEMLNPRVQLYGDVAVMTYQIVNYKRQQDGSERADLRWNSTAVFRRIEGNWRTVHSHWSLTKPELKQPTIG